MEIRIDPREAIAQWVLDTSGLRGCFLPGYKALGVFDGETLLGACIYDGFTAIPGALDCNMHVCIAHPRCLSRRVLRAVFDYPFCQLRLDRVSAQVMSDNEKSMEFVQRLGFVNEGAKRLQGRYQVLFGMLRHESPWHTDPVEHQFAQMLAGAA